MSHNTITPAAVAAPAGLTAVVHDDSTVALSWNAVAGATAYGIFEMLTDPAHTFKQEVSTTSSTRGPLAGGHYRYGVTARNGAGESAMSALVDVQVPAGGQQATGHVDLSRWKLTMPVADPHGPDNTLWEIPASELATFSHADFSVQNGVVTYIAPVQGVTTSGHSGATRCELREMAGPHGADEAAWTFGSGTHTLTCTLTCDPTGASPRKECTVGQIHDEFNDDKNPPPIRLAVNLTDVPGELKVFPRGLDSQLLLDGLQADTVFTYRIRVTDDGKCRIWAAKGGVDALPDAPKATFDKSMLKKNVPGGHLPGECFFKAGAYNLSKIDDGHGHQGSGKSVVQHFLVALD